MWFLVDKSTKHCTPLCSALLCSTRQQLLQTGKDAGGTDLRSNLLLKMQSRTSGYDISGGKSSASGVKLLNDIGKRWSIILHDLLDAIIQ